MQPGLDSQTLATLGATSVDDGTARTGSHANAETVGTLAAGNGRLIGTFHLVLACRNGWGRSRRPILVLVGTQNATGSEPAIRHENLLVCQLLRRAPEVADAGVAPERQDLQFPRHAPDHLMAMRSSALAEGCEGIAATLRNAAIFPAATTSKPPAFASTFFRHFRRAPVDNSPASDIE